MIGSTLSHYTILEKLGEGGMGVVYKARDTHLDRFVAIKVLPTARVADPERKRRFVQEAKAASALNHPNIITVHDIARENGEPGVWKVPVEGGEESRVIPSLDDWGNFDLNGRGIYFIPNRSVNAPIQFYNFADGGIKTLAQTVGTPGFGLTVSPDGRTVLYSQVDQQTSELALVNFR